MPSKPSAKLSRHELNEVIQWDVRNWGKALKFWNKHFPAKEEMKVLALGEREGGLSYYFAKKKCEVICSDYNDFPATTVNFHKEKGVDDWITYAKIDMKSIDFPDEYFDAVVFKSVLGALGNKEDQDKAMDEMYRVLKPGGALLFAENAAGSRFHRYMRRKFVNWGKRWRYIRKKDLIGWAGKFTDYRLKSFGAVAVFGRNEKQRGLFSGFDTVISPLTPPNWRYIYFGVFVK